MSSIENIHNQLDTIFPDVNFYYNPPTTLTLTYPCFVGSLVSNPLSHANNSVYNVGEVYQVTYLDTSPEFQEINLMYGIPGTSLINVFRSQNITNYVFNIRVNTI